MLIPNQKDGLCNELSSKTCLTVKTRAARAASGGAGELALSLTVSRLQAVAETPSGQVLLLQPPVQTGLFPLEEPRR